MTDKLSGRFFHCSKHGCLDKDSATVVLSFACYISVVLFADTIPALGMLIPKTCAYVWTVLIGYHAMKKENPS